MEQGTYRRAVLLSEDELNLLYHALSLAIEIDGEDGYEAQAREAHTLYWRLRNEHNGTDLCP